MIDFVNFTGFKNLVMNFKLQIIESKKQFMPKGEKCIDKDTFFQDNPLAGESIFSKLDLDGDGYISEQEYFQVAYQIDSNGDGIISQSEVDENKSRCMNEALFFARRNIDKWFTIDIDRDGYWSNVESEMAKYRMNERYEGIEHIKDASLTNEELAKKYNMKERVQNDWGFKNWTEEWLEYIKTDIAKNNYGVELSVEDMKILRAEMYKQLNIWLFKTGDNATGNAPLYNSLNVTAYTRLMTTKESVSCCGGDITPPPMSDIKSQCAYVFRPLEYSYEQYQEAEKKGIELNPEILKNNSDEIKNRLFWSAFATPPKDRLDTNPDHTVWQSLSDDEYAELNNRWNKMRNTTAKELRDMLKPENKAKCKEFEKYSIMTVKQMVQYIDIVESVTGKDWDSSDWEVNAVQFYEIGGLVNGTTGDENRLEGKTRADIPPNRQNLLRFIEKNGYLDDRFNEQMNESAPVEIKQSGIVQQSLQINEKNRMIYNKELNTAARKIISNMDREKIVQDKFKELAQLYNPRDYEWIVEVNEYGDVFWAVRKRQKENENRAG